MTDHRADFESISDAFAVKLAQFEGPLDLLLHLIKKNEVNIHDIPIATITTQYLSAIALMEELNLDVAGEYLVMLVRLAKRLVGRLAERFAERFACLDLGRADDRRLRAARAGFFRRVAFALAMTRPFGTLTVCR